MNYWLSKISGDKTLLLKGGLGNQLFQLSYAVDVVQNTTSGIRMLDLSYLLDKKRTSALDLIYPALIHKKKLSDYLAIPFISKYIAQLKILKYLIITDLNKYHPNLQAKFISGYFQNYEYTHHVIPQLSNYLKFEVPSVKIQSICLHVRRTDFMKNSELALEYKSLMNNYYRAAIEKANQLSPNNSAITIISDDVEGALQDLKKITTVKFEILPESSMWIDFKVMAMADVLIASNSTFSWWAARLNTKNVILPKIWLDREHANIKIHSNLNIPSAILI